MALMGVALLVAGILFDTFHANIEEKDVAAALLSVGTYLKHFHACENDRGTPGSGHVDWPAVFRALRSLHYIAGGAFFETGEAFSVAGEDLA